MKTQVEVNYRGSGGGVQGYIKYEHKNGNTLNRFTDGVNSLQLTFSLKGWQVYNGDIPGDYEATQESKARFMKSLDQWQKDEQDGKDGVL